MTLALVLWVVGMGVVWAVVAGGARKPSAEPTRDAR